MLVKNMALKAGDDSPAYKDMDIDDEEDEFKRESVDLASIRNDYGIEESKPDFLDLDKDGDEEESMKDAAEDAEDDDVKEGFSTEAEQVLAQCGSGELDCYDVMTNPKTPAEATAAKIIQQMYDDVAIDHHLHPDDDFEKILDIVADQLDNDYGNSDADTREAVNPYAVSKNEAVESTSVNAMEAALAELRKLAGLR